MKIEQVEVEKAQNRLTHFIHLVENQSGKHITVDTAQTLIESVQAVIDALQQPQESVGKIEEK